MDGISTIVFTGLLSAYAMNPTVGTINYRQYYGQIPHNLESYDVLLAVDHCGLIGHEGQMIAGDDVYSALVFDCAGAGGAHYFTDGNADTPWLLAGEADWDFWQDNPHVVGELVRIEIEVMQ